MSFGQNLQFLRKMRNKMTQEELAERLGVSRQTVSKWELDTAYPEMNKIIDLCEIFSCSLDQIIREDMNMYDDIYSEIRTDWVEPFSYTIYTVISPEPEEDAISHIRSLAEKLGIREPDIIGWDFPEVSQEQINVFNMHGYTAALMLPENYAADADCPQVIRQEKQKYISITISRPEQNPFRVIPNAYKILLTYMKMNGINPKHDKSIISCFEREYCTDTENRMDIFIAIE